MIPPPNRGNATIYILPRKFQPEDQRCSLFQGENSGMLLKPQHRLAKERDCSPQETWVCFKKKKKNQAAATRQSSAVSDLVISVYCCTRFQKKYQRKKNWVCNLVISPSQRKYQSINKPANSSVKPQPSREFPELFSPSIIQPVIFQK